MDEYEEITHNNLPEAVKHLLHEIAFIKAHLLNNAASILEPTQPVSEKEFLTVDEVSEMIRLSKGTVYNMKCNGQIPCIKKGSRVLFEREVIEKWLREDRRKTNKQLQAEAEMEIRKK